MAKKKNQSKKHKFKYADPSNEAIGMQGAAETPVSGTVARSRQAVATGPTRDFSYVAADLRRILVLAVVLVGVEVALWFLFTHSGVGNQVYNIVRV